MKRLALTALLMLCGCQKLTKPAPLEPLDRPYFDCKVTDVLTKTCSGFRCHGDAARYYTVFTRNRLRFGGTEEDRGAPLREIESSFNYTATLVHVDPADPDNSLLLLKPLEQDAGGYFHRGAEIFDGGDVFVDREDRDFKVLADWVNGATEDPSCRESIQ